MSFGQINRFRCGNIEFNYDDCFAEEYHANEDGIWVTTPTTNQFSDDYILGDQFENGVLGSIYDCIRKSDNKRFSVKIIPKLRLYDINPWDDFLRKEMKKCLESEVNIMKQCNHKYIIKFITSYETRHKLFIVVEECKHDDLFDRIKSRKRYNENDAKSVIRKICQVLFYLHHELHVVYNALKPSNILFVNDSELSDIKLIDTDCGYSRICHRLSTLSALTGTPLIGTPYYTSPEIIRGKYCHSSDLWSLGVITYIMIYGFPPFYANTNKYDGIAETKKIYRQILKGFIPQIKRGYGRWFNDKLTKTLKISDECIDFMSCLIETDTQKRMTIKEALQHPWLNDINNLKMDYIGLSLANYATSNEIKHIITLVYAEHYRNIRPLHIKQIKGIFSDNDKIYFKTFTNMLLNCNQLSVTKKQIEIIFDALDTCNNGYIQFDDILKAEIFDHVISSDDRFQKCFDFIIQNDLSEIRNNVISLVQNQIYTSNWQYALDNIYNSEVNKKIGYEYLLRSIHPNSNNNCLQFSIGQKDDSYYANVATKYINYNSRITMNKMIPYEIIKMILLFYGDFIRYKVNSLGTDINIFT